MPAKSKPSHGQANKDELLMVLRSLVPSGHVEAEFRFHPERMWRFDFAVPSLLLAVEYDGINTFGGHAGRHTSITGISGDHEKRNSAAVLGWRVISFTKLHFCERQRKKHKLRSPWEVLQQAVGSHNLNPAPEQGVLL